MVLFIGDDVRSLALVTLCSNWGGGFAYNVMMLLLQVAFDTENSKSCINDHTCIDCSATHIDMAYSGGQVIRRPI